MESRSEKRDRVVVMTQMVLPSHANALGNVFGGTIMSWIDIAGAIAARCYAKQDVVTVSIDSLYFMVPVKIGDIVEVRAEVTWAGRTSMEVEANVFKRDFRKGQLEKTTMAYLTYVAIDKEGVPMPVPPYVPADARERERFEQAKLRRENRLKLKQKQ